ncbi:MAG: methyltransferase domain-containing protein [Leptonema sp. (in: bacteria)]
MKPVGNGIYVNSKWKFNKEVAKHFDVHIKKSIPLYEEGHKLIIDVISHYVLHHKTKKPQIILDLGCSTGSLIYKISKNFSDIPILFYGLDLEPSMLDIAKKRKFSKNHKVHWISSKIEKFDFPFAFDICISYYSLQFIPVQKRKYIVSFIYKKLYKKGFFLLFEKVKFKNPFENQINQYLIEKYKLSSGYTLEEIKNKEESLKNVLIPLTSQKNFELLKQAGFKKYFKIMQYSFFEGILAIK